MPARIPTGFVGATRKAKSFSVYTFEVYRGLVLVMSFARSSAVVGTRFIEHGGIGGNAETISK